jgi:hypothetical protein
MLVKRKYNIGDKVKIQTQNDKGWVWYDCEIIDCERKQIYVNGEYENVYKLQTVDNPTFCFYRCEGELDLMNPRKEVSMSEFDECYEMQSILLRLETVLSNDKPFSDFEKCKIHDAWVAVKSMEEYLNLENYKEE